MWGWFERKSREKRARNYLKAYPDDEPAVEMILFNLDTFGLKIVKSARQVAETASGRKMSNAEWASFGPRWERAWAAIVPTTNSEQRGNVEETTLLKLREVVDSDFVDARLMLSTMKIKLQKEGSEATILLGEGVGEVAGLLAKRFGISVPEALVGRHLNWKQLGDAYRDMLEATEKGRPMLNAASPTARNFAHKHTFGSLILSTLYRLRFLTEHAAEDQREEAAAIADRVADFARVMAEIGATIRDPADAWK